MYFCTCNFVTVILPVIIHFCYHVYIFELPPFGKYCTVPKYRAAVNYTPRLRAPWNLPRCMAHSDTCEAVANNYPGSATANSYLGMTST